MSVDPIDNIPPVANEIVEPEIEPVPASASARGAKELVADGDDTESTLTSSDMVDISVGARQLSALAREAKSRTEATEAAIRRMASGPAVRELRATMARYDNGAAVRAYEGYLALFARYGSAAELLREELAALRGEPVDKFSFHDLGVFTGVAADTDQRRAVAVSMDRWFEGQGVFKPEMLYFSSGLGFRLSPRSEAARNARNASAVLATDSPAKIAAYLREMAHLAPSDFTIYDPTGLSALTLSQRRNFLASADAILARAGIDVRAAELAYAFDADGAVKLARRESGNARAAQTTGAAADAGRTSQTAITVQAVQTTPDADDAGAVQNVDDGRGIRDDPNARNNRDDPMQRLLRDIERALNTGIPGLEAAVSTIRRYGAVISGGS